MNIRLEYPLYNADGSSFTLTRCNQICDVYDMTMKSANFITSYRGIQELATENNIFGTIGFTQTASAIRTIFPILKKLGLIIAYDEVKEFKIYDFFTSKGKAFVLTHKALVKAQEIENKPLIHECEDAKSAILRDGIKYMFDRGSYPEHNIWFALTYLKYQKQIIWKEFLYMVYLYNKGYGLLEIEKQIQKNRDINIQYNYVSTDGAEIKSTSYSYLKALLTEAEIVKEYQKGVSVTTYKGYDFLNQLNL